MEAKEQAEGERRVRDLLIDPLEALGAGKPTTVVGKGSFEKMKRTLCQYLAGSDEAHLLALKDWALANLGGPQKDRFPIAAKFLEQSRKMTPPDAGGGPSPLMLAIFAHGLGRAAIQEGWAPELLGWIRSRPEGERRWPGPWSVDQVKRQADAPRRRLEDVELRMAEDREVSRDDLRFRDQRLAGIRECENIARQGVGGGE